MKVRRWKFGYITLLLLVVTAYAGVPQATRTDAHVLQRHATLQPIAPQHASGTSHQHVTPALAGGNEVTKRVGGSASARALSKAHAGVVFYSGSTQYKQVALTFDDGPDELYTPKILRVLKQNGIRATFFVIGKRAQAHPEMVRRIAAAGHVIGNHSWNHPDLNRLDPLKVRSEIVDTNQLLHNIVGYYPALFRPPYGSATDRVVNEVSALGFRIVDWSVDTRDWAGTPVTTIMTYVNKEVRPGGIILEHCAGGEGEDLDNTVQALPRIIDGLRAQGYRFVTVPQLLHVPATKVK